MKRIMVAKCKLFFHYCEVKEISFYYFLDTKHKTLCKTHVNSINIVVIKFVRLINGVQLTVSIKFRVSSQIMAPDYCIVRCKKFSACDRLLMVLWVLFFKIQNIYINSISAIMEYVLLNKEETTLSYNLLTGESCNVGIRQNVQVSNILIQRSLHYYISLEVKKHQFSISLFLHSKFNVLMKIVDVMEKVFSQCVRLRIE